MKFSARTWAEYYEQLGIYPRFHSNRIRKGERLPLIRCAFVANLRNLRIVPIVRQIIGAKPICADGLASRIISREPHTKATGDFNSGRT